jgi:hypothetical protein
MRNNIPTVTAVGRQGDWTAEIVEWNERLPCVHQYFWTGRDYYEDPHPELLTYPEFKDYIALMREKGRVILTKDKVDPNKPYGPGKFQRDGYVGVYEIDDLTTDGGLRFRFVRRVSSVK